MYKVMAVDPGTIHTGYVVGECDNGVVQILKMGQVSVDKKLPPPKRIHGILSELVEVATALDVQQIWTELFVPYGARTGAMWNTALSGAIVYLPSTRQQEDWVTYAVHPSTWKSWFARPFKDRPCTSGDMIRETLQTYDLYSDELYMACIKSQHVADAVGILLFSQYGDPDVEQASPA